MGTKANPVAAEVDAILHTYPTKARTRLKQVRRLIYQVARETPEVGTLTETTKWSEPAYLTEQTKAGVTLRMAWKAKRPDEYALFVNCQSGVLDTLRTINPELVCEGNRAIWFDLNQPCPEDDIRLCAQIALTWHANKRRSKRA